MSRSRRHTPITGTCTAVTEKQWKRMWNRKMRLRFRDAIARGEETMPVRPSDYGPKDGKMSFDAALYPKLMRK